jgi:hypothetical protein
VEELQVEKLLMLGDVKEGFNQELLKPLINYSFHRMMTKGLLPPIPEILQDAELEVQFISQLALAQKTSDKGIILDMMAFIANLAQTDPEVLDNFDKDYAVRAYRTAVGADPKVLHSDTEVSEIRNARAQREAQMQELAAAQAGAKAAKDISTANMNDARSAM